MTSRPLAWAGTVQRETCLSEALPGCLELFRPPGVQLDSVRLRRACHAPQRSAACHCVPKELGAATEAHPLVHACQPYSYIQAYKLDVPRYITTLLSAGCFGGLGDSCALLSTHKECEGRLITSRQHSEGVIFCLRL